ncbi:MAG TPA: efflux RND transporter periplasmic adaptor subunit [Terriglobales bacterium]|nr:efflux RND transporter periplasmic adaptor subunit [Terriglobales bacterium]
MKKPAKGVRKGGCPHPPSPTKSSRLVPSPRTRASGAMWPVVVLGMLLVFFSGCSKELGEKEPVVPVQVVAVEKTTIQHAVVAEAVLFPLAQSAIVPKISAPVKTFLVTRGSRVREGELLAVLEHQDLAAAAVDTKGTYDQAQATYEISTGADLPAEMQKAQLETQAAKQMLDAQQKVYDSRQELFQQGALPRKELDLAGVDLTQARNQYEMAQRHLDAMQAIGKQQTLKSAAGQLESAKGKYLGATAQLSYSEIRSPISGVIADRPLYPGEMAAAGTPLLTVMDVSQVIARAHIPQPDAALLKLGDKATITAPGDDQRTEGRITVISPALDPNSTTVEVWVQAKNPEQRLKPGTSVQLSMLARTIPDALVIPAASLLSAQDGTTSVMLVGSDNRAHQKAVKVGVRQDNQVQIVEGVQAGDRVVASGAYGLPDNTKINVEEQQQQKDPNEKSTGGAEK